MKNVFEGIKVAEFAWVVVGPSTSGYLADHGATVVKIESHIRLDTNRINGPFVGGGPTPDGSMFYGKHNPDKYCISIDLQSPGGKKLARKIIEWADIVTDAISPGSRKMGTGLRRAKKINPDVIYLVPACRAAAGLIPPMPDTDKTPSTSAVSAKSAAGRKIAFSPLWSLYRLR